MSNWHKFLNRLVRAIVSFAVSEFMYWETNKPPDGGDGDG